MGLKGWFFFTLTLNGKELTQTLWERICLAENEEPVKKPNKEQNIINVLVEQVKRGDCINSEEEMMEVALIENIQREDLNAIEEAEGYADLNSKYDLSHDYIAKTIGKKRTTISNALRLLKLPSDIRKSIRRC